METPSFCEPHFHSAVEILYASEGAVDTFINGAPRTIGKGEICISDSYDVHNFDSHGLKCRILIIPSDFLDDYFKVRGKKHVASNYVTDKALCVKIDAVMRQFCDKPSPLLSKAYVNLILGLIADETGFSDAAAEDFHIMKKILDYLENNYSSGHHARIAFRRIRLQQVLFFADLQPFFPFQPEGIPQPPAGAAVHSAHAEERGRRYHEHGLRLRFQFPADLLPLFHKLLRHGARKNISRGTRENDPAKK